MKGNIKAGIALSTSCILLLSACSHSPTPFSKIQDGPPTQKAIEQVDVSTIPNAVPKTESLSKYGNPPNYVVFGKTYHVLTSAEGYDKKGIASWYGTKFQGRKTSSGEPYNMFAMTAASPVLPIPTYVQVTNLNNGRQVIVKVNDRGPFHSNRIMDLSYVAAKKLGITAHGTGLVEVKAIDPSSYNQSKNTQVAQVKPQQPKLYLQVGAFSDKYNAEKLKLALAKSLKQPVEIRSLQENQHPLYRVQVGPLASVEQNDHIADQLFQEGYPKPISIIE